MERGGRGGRRRPPALVPAGSADRRPVPDRATTAATVSSRRGCFAEAGYDVAVGLLAAARPADRRRGPRRARLGRTDRVPRSATSPPAPTSSSMRCSAPASIGRSRAWPRSRRRRQRERRADPRRRSAERRSTGAPGAVLGPRSSPTESVTFFRRKPGHLLLPGTAARGPVTVADIGIDLATLDAIRPTPFHNLPALWLAALPRPRIDGHKYDRGHAVVVSGPMIAHRRRAARGARRRCASAPGSSPSPRRPTRSPSTPRT